MTRPIQIRYVGITILAGRADTQFLAACDIGVEIRFYRRSKIDFLNRAVRTDSYVVGAAYVDRVNQMAEHVLPGRYGRRGNQVGHEKHTEVAAAVGQGFENFVGLIARMRINSGASRMGDQHRLGRRSDRFAGGAIAAVTEVDRHSRFVHLLDCRDTSFA